jgi:hypothetical protein
MWQSMVAMIVAATLFVAVTFAWFATASQVNQDDLLLNFNPLDFEFSLYRFRDSAWSGIVDERLGGSMCTLPTEDRCFEPHNESDMFAFPNPFGFRPSQKLSFVMRITNLGASKSFDLELFNVLSLGYVLPQNAVQRAFEYHVISLVYWNGSSEDDSLMSDPAIDYAGKDPLSSTHFALTADTAYPLVKNAPLTSDIDSKTALVYFTIRFDPTIKGVDELGQPTQTSNAFQNQTMQIRGLRLKQSPGGS